MEEKEIKTIVINLPKDLYDKYSDYCKWEERDINKQTRKLIRDFCEKSEQDDEEISEIQMKEVNAILGIDSK